jgi:hypothetical protein
MSDQELLAETLRKVGSEVLASLTVKRTVFRVVTP